jgi:hypothetical protein
MVPLYAARIEDLGPVDFVVECPSCNNVGLLSGGHKKGRCSGAPFCFSPVA